jgi:hypothetical protein
MFTSSFVALQSACNKPFFSLAGCFIPREFDFSTQLIHGDGQLLVTT